VLVLVVVVVLGLVMVALARYTTTTLVYGQTTEERADRFAAAQGAMDNAIERLEIKRSLCGTNTGVGSITEPFPELINGATATVTCQSIGGTSGDVDGWAVVLTGVGNPTNDLVTESGGGKEKYIGGPVWMERTDHLDIKTALTIERGDLWYPGACMPDEFTGRNLASRLSYSEGNGTMCTSGSWSTTFRAPVTTVPSAVASPNGVVDAYGCTVFQPGRYNVKPVLGAANYFKSGNYYLHDVGTITIKDKKVLFGNMSGIVGFPSITNSPCNFARGSDSTDGATVYVDGSTRFLVDTHGSLEFSGKRQNGKDVVSLQVISSGLGTEPTWSDPVLRTDPGNNKELAIQGLVWAPASGLQFDNVTNDTTAVLRGGAVLASLDAGASASATDFLIEVATTDAQRMLRLTATATKDGQSSIRAVIDWRATTGETALKTWRSCETATC
jgi:hypothetical protein